MKDGKKLKSFQLFRRVQTRPFIISEYSIGLRNQLARGPHDRAAATVSVWERHTATTPVRWNRDEHRALSLPFTFELTNRSIYIFLMTAKQKTQRDTINLEHQFAEGPIKF